MDDKFVKMESELATVKNQMKKMKKCLPTLLLEKIFMNLLLQWLLLWYIRLVTRYYNLLKKIN